MLTEEFMQISAKSNHWRNRLVPYGLKDTELRRRSRTSQNGSFSQLAHPKGLPNSVPFHRDQQYMEKPPRGLRQDHLQSLMSAEHYSTFTVDPIVEILDAFYSIPRDYYSDIFDDFRDAANSQDLRQLLDVFSNWAATAELYAHPSLATDLLEAIGNRKGVADWLPG